MESFEVENFRSLKHLKLEKLARVNLLMGKNNSGKTSVLEAVYALSGINSSNWYDNLLKGRDMTPSEAPFRQLFYGLTDNTVIKILASYSDADFRSHVHTIEAKITLNNIAQEADSGEADWEPSRSLKIPNDDGLAISLQTESMSIPASYELTIPENRLGRRLKNITPGALELAKSLRLTGNYRLLSSFVSSRPRVRNLSSVIERLKIAKKDDELISILRQVDSRIERIELGGNGQIYFNLGPSFSTLLSTNLMGEGVQRLLIIASVMINRSGGLVFIDEIDNGLHYSVLRILWKGILQAAREYDVQVFATTHSAEALRHLTRVLDEEENASYRDDVAAYTLMRAEDDTMRSYRYDYEQLDYAVDHGLEVRN